MSKNIKNKKRKKGFSLFPYYCDKLLIITVFLLIIFSSIMVASAAMGEGAGDTGVITRTLIRQSAFFVFGLILMTLCSRIYSFLKIDFIKKTKSKIFEIAYWIVFVSLLATRLSGPTYGAYGWIRLGSVSVQPSEFAKIYIVLYGAKLLGRDSIDNKKNFFNYMLKAFIYFFTILVYQHDTGSAVVLAGMAFVIMLIPPYKEYDIYHGRMLLLLGLLIVGIVIIMTPAFNEFLASHAGNYMVGRFLAADNPFAYQYDTGYHLIMGLVSFATGGLFGLGYGQSIHKYMNFPNPTTDFILPVIVEELGVIGGLLPILVAYGIIFYKLIRYSIDVNCVSSKMILVGTFTYLAVHFVLNVGGVSGLIPLTGVPLLFVSSGGSSLVASMVAIGFCENEIIRFREEKARFESSGWQIQKD